MTFIERLSNLKTNQATGCWEFQGYCDPSNGGYGLLQHGGKRVLVHRSVWEMVFGEIPPVLCVLHTCDNPPCANPAHLWLGTKADNNADKARKGRAPKITGEMNGAAKLTAKQVLAIRSDKRPQRRIAADYGVHQGQISRVKAGKYWKETA